MSDDPSPLLNFEHQLKLEAQRVLDDAIFQRAPIQTRLLEYLVQRTLSDPAPPTQYEIAVDGLGKDEDYDLEGDSYPRVQVSRLRRSLENYYARNLPGEGLRLEVEAGSYRLTLAPAKAPGGLARRFRPTKPQGLPWRTFPSRATALTMLGAVALASSPLLIMGVSPVNGSISDAAPSKPSTALIVEGASRLPGESAGGVAFASAQRAADIQLTNSFVSKPIALGQKPRDADYSLSLNFGPGEDKAGSLYLALADKDGDILYSNEILADPEQPGDFSSELEASLVYITSPTGLIAQAELPRRKNAASSDYACFIAIENRRSNGSKTAQLVDDCIARFPQSDYRSYWYARRAFTRYQNDISEGRMVGKSGPGWADLQAALEADPYNAFANFTAAKVELAKGRCRAARVYVNQALERGGSYPALVAAVEANAAACPGTPEEDAVVAMRIRSLARFNPNPDPLLHLYLMVGLLAADDRDTARRVAQRADIANPEGPIEETSDLLRRSLEDPQVAFANRDTLSDAIYSLVWNEAATRKVVSALTQS